MAKEMFEDNKKLNDSDKNLKDDEKNVDGFMQEFHEHGLNCGSKIADIAKEIHPNALVIVPLYRSCIIIEQSEEERKDGVCTLHSYADPHWLGEEIDIDTLKLDDFHFEFCIRGDRQGPAIVNKNNDEYVDKIDEEDEGRNKDEDDEPIVIEHDEN